MVTHQVVPTQATDSNPLAAAMVTGAVQAVPSYWTTWFRLGTATQKVAAVQARYDAPWGDGALPTGPMELTEPLDIR